MVQKIIIYIGADRAFLLNTQCLVGLRPLHQLGINLPFT